MHKVPHPLTPLAINPLLLRAVLGAFRQANLTYAEAGELLRSGQSGELYTTVSPRFVWAQHYELPFVDHVAKSVVAIGMASHLVAVASAIRAGKLTSIFRLFGDDSGVASPQVHPDLVFGLTIAVKYSLLSVVQQGATLNKLIAQVRDSNDESALFDVLRIDPSAVSNPSIAYRISQAALAQRVDFFSRLGGVIKDNATFKLRALAELDLMLAIVDGLGGLDGMSEEQQSDLFVKKLGLYPPEEANQGKRRDRRSLSRYIDRWRTKHATGLREEMSSPVVG